MVRIRDVIDRKRKDVEQAVNKTEAKAYTLG
jgi:hypothetical protein